MRGLYFVEHGLDKTQAKGLNEALQSSLNPVGLQLYEAKTEADTSSLMNICQAVYLSSLGIFDLSVPNPHTYLKIGISLGLNKPGLIIAGQGMTAAIPKVLDRANTWFYMPPLKADKDFQRVVLRIIDNYSRSQNNNANHNGNHVEANGTYCSFCDRSCKGWRKHTRGKGFFLLDGTCPTWPALQNSIQVGLSPTGLTPIYLSQLKGRTMPLLCEMRLAALASEFTLLDASILCDPEQYIALGMAISMRRPWLLTTSQPDNLPPLLRQANCLEYASDQDLQQRLGQHIFKSLYPTKFTKTSEATAQLALPFWLQLEDWIKGFESRASRVMEGSLQLLLVEEGQLKQRCRMTPEMTITAGRDPECDLVIESQSASHVHADFTFTGHELYVIDRNSTNGTFVGGSKIPEEEQVPVQIGDRIRIGTAEVVIWDEAELPEEVKQYLPESGRVIPQTIFINPANGLVLAEGKVAVARLTGDEINLLEFLFTKRNETANTSEIAEIVYGTDRVSRMIVASFIDRLRAKIEPVPSKPRFLMSVPGKGYRLRTRGGQLALLPK